MLTNVQCYMLKYIAESPGLTHRELLRKYNLNTNDSRYRAIHGLFLLGLIQNAYLPGAIKSAGKWSVTEKGKEVLSHVILIENLCGGMC